MAAFVVYRFPSPPSKGNPHDHDHLQMLTLLTLIALNVIVWICLIGAVRAQTRRRTITARQTLRRAA